jgi:hypothetical protein
MREVVIGCNNLHVTVDLILSRPSRLQFLMNIVHTVYEGYSRKELKLKD